MLMIRRFLAIAAALCITFGVEPADAQVASFDCRKAQSDTEFAICNTPTLGKMDVEMATLYGILQNAAERHSAQEHKTLLNAQAHWRTQERDTACGGDTGCLATAYRSRIKHLRETAKTHLRFE